MLTATWDLTQQNHDITVLGYASRGGAFVVLGLFLGTFMDHRRRLEAELLRYFDASLDLLATANSRGYFSRVNAAWETTLGYTREEMVSVPYIDLVHPDDRAGTVRESARLGKGSCSTIRFRNRYKAADGAYHWLEWSANASPDGSIHAVARDISGQVEAEQQLANSASLLEAKVSERTRELKDARDETLQRLARAGEYRDYETFQHTERVGASAAEIAEQLGLDSEQVELIRKAAPLHDIGKLAISDTILLKPGPLTPEEREIMEGHAEAGRRLLSGSRSPVLQMAATIAATHHERWEGTGYPEGLAAESIPLVGRVVTLADVFDALTHDRPYKSAWTSEQALAKIKHMAGEHFDPRVVDAFLRTPTARDSQPALPHDEAWLVLADKRP
jgi:PAS domain S-box-containing protein/putative nucleotidyltransferase with HDIG domain